MAGTAPENDARIEGGSKEGIRWLLFFICSCCCYAALDKIWETVPFLFFLPPFFMIFRFQLSKLGFWFRTEIGLKIATVGMMFGRVSERVSRENENRIRNEEFVRKGSLENSRNGLVIWKNYGHATEKVRIEEKLDIFPQGDLIPLFAWCEPFYCQFSKKKKIIIDPLVNFF